MSCTVVTGAIATSSRCRSRWTPSDSSRPTIVKVVAVDLDLLRRSGRCRRTARPCTVCPMHDHLGVVGDVVGGEEAALGDLVVAWRPRSPGWCRSAGRAGRWCPRSPAVAWALTTGDTGLHVGRLRSCRWRASTSLSVSWVLRLWAAAPPRPPTKPPVDHGDGVGAEAVDVVLRPACDDPLPTATSTITEPTPIMMPSIVSAERSLLAERPRSAMRSASHQSRPPARRRAGAAAVDRRRWRWSLDDPAVHAGG